jgi:CBS-domain-containing membrane protein
MTMQFDALETITLNDGTKTLHPPKLPELTHIDDLALTVMLDFQYQHPITVHCNTTIDDAAIEMKANNVHLLFVIDDEGAVIGLTNSRLLHGEIPYKIMQEKRIKHSEITVGMLMLAREKILCLDYESVKTAKIGSIIENFKSSKRHYALVIDLDDEGKQQIHGYFSASRISKSLGQDIKAESSAADSIAELQNMLREFE